MQTVRIDSKNEINIVQKIMITRDNTLYIKSNKKMNNSYVADKGIHAQMLLINPINLVCANS